VPQADRLVKTSDCFRLWLRQDDVRFFAFVTMFITGFIAGLFLVRRQMRVGLLATFLLMAGVAGPLGIAAAALPTINAIRRVAIVCCCGVYERGRAPAEASGAEALAAADVEVWSLDPTSSYFLRNWGAAWMQCRRRTWLTGCGLPWPAANRSRSMPWRARRFRYCVDLRHWSLPSVLRSASC
jgi:hypothetical protein